jgi:hypothetical protein
VLQKNFSNTNQLLKIKYWSMTWSYAGGSPRIALEKLLSRVSLLPTGSKDSATLMRQSFWA